MDSDISGTLDAGETGIANVTLTLTGTTGQGQSVTATTTTAADGTYSFSQDSKGNALLPGTYQIVETQPSGYVQVAANVGTVNGTVKGTTSLPGKIASIVMQSNQTGVNYNFGLSVPASASGYVYLDNNKNGVRNPGDGGFANRTVTLTGTDRLGRSVTLTTTTDANGFYIFSNFLAGTYSISVTAPGGIYLPDAANVGTVNNVTVGVAADSNTEIDQIQLLAGNSGEEYDFGFLRPHA
jgi:hypothetical protein